MKHLIILLLILGISDKENLKTINWERNLEVATKLAKSENKPIFIYFGADWCAPCKITEKQVFSESKFVEFSKKYVMVKIYDDYDNKNQKDYEYYQEKKSEYQINSIPVFILVDNGTEKARFSGIFRKPSELINKINSFK